MLERMLFNLPKGSHDKEAIRLALESHPEIQFVSLCGADILGNDTDEKIPVRVMLEDIEGFLADGVQTDGSSVLLPKIADISNAKVDIVPDLDCNWYVDYNFRNIDDKTGLPVGSLRIPAYLKHNGIPVGSRSILKKSLDVFKKEFIRILKENPYVFEYLPIDSVDEIDEVCMTSATEMEFYVKTPHEVADKDRLHTSQELKEQYWKRTVGPVRTALERTICLLEHYGFNVEMGHKEVGGVKPTLESGGGFEHIMEQLEIDWKYADPIQAADNNMAVRYIVKDEFRYHGLDVTFMAKPVEGVAGSGKHTHLGVACKLKNGKMVNLFTALDPDKDYMSPVGYGALMGLLKNYEVISPFANNTNDDFNRLKPGFEAPVSIATSLGHSIENPTRNRTVLAGLIRDKHNPLATRFELRAPSPKSNGYLVEMAGFMAILDGIEAALKAKKTPEELCASISKEYGTEDFYLDKDRIYRAENNIFKDYTTEERDKLFGVSPKTAWENICALDRFPEKTAVLMREGVMTEQALDSFKTAAIDQWAMSMHDRLIEKMLEEVRECRMVHDKNSCSRVDESRWDEISKMRIEIAKDTSAGPCLLTQLSKALDAEDYEKASEMQFEISEKILVLEKLYKKYTKNILDI